MDSRPFGLSVVEGRLKTSSYPKPHGGDGCSGHPLPRTGCRLFSNEIAVVLELLNATVAGGTD
jgi:hypothetical protein